MQLAHRIWGHTARVLGVLLLTGGLTITLGSGAEVVLSQASGPWLALWTFILVTLGLGPASLGAWLVYTSAQARQRAIQETFFQLLRTRQGRFTLVEFAMAARLEPAAARRYLDQWAKDCTANFEVDAQGEVVYVFRGQADKSLTS